MAKKLHVIKQGGQGLSVALPAYLFLKNHDPPDGEASGENALEAFLPSAAARAAAAPCDISVDRHRSVRAWTIFQASTIRHETASTETPGVFERANALGLAARR